MKVQKDKRLEERMLFAFDDYEIEIRFNPHKVEANEVMFKLRELSNDLEDRKNSVLLKDI